MIVYSFFVFAAVLLLGPNTAEADLIVSAVNGTHYNITSLQIIYASKYMLLLPQPF